MLIVVSTGYGTYYVKHGDPVGFLYLFAGAVLIYGYFRYGPVYIAFHHVRRKNFERGEQLLRQVRHPALLASGQRSYFELASALIALHHGKHDAAEQHVRAALSQKLRSENHRAFAEMLLAQLLIQRGDFDEARATLESARKRPCSPEVAKTIEEVSKSLPVE